MMKRLLSLVTAFCLMLGCLPGSVFATEPAAQMGTMELDMPVQVNPLYAGSVLAAEGKAPEKAGFAPLAQAEYLPEEQAVKELRRNLKNRTENFTIYVQAPGMMLDQESIRELVLGLFESALAHTGDPEEGDYLRWQYGWISVTDIQYSGTENDFRLAIPYTVEYYTTAGQEQELDSAVAELLRDLDLEDVCDYEKVRGIYDYMIGSITYDYDNLNDSSHVLKYTAYAALMNKTAICQGYAVLFYRLALELGVDARLVPGDSNGDGTTDHAWNIVRLNGQYYCLDATFDAEIGRAQWFLLGTGSFTGHDPDYSYVEAGFQENHPMSRVDYVHEASETVTAPTCTEAGYTTYTCSCGESYRDDEVAAAGHTWNSGEVTQEPTEGAPGIRTYTCTVCGGTREETVPALEHSHSYQGAVTAPTCTEAGYTTYTCSCGDSYRDDEVAAAGHTWNSGEVTQEPTESAPGIRTYTCTICGGTREETVPALEHSHSYQGAVTAPTCTEAGYTTYTCSCGESYRDDEVAAAGHTEVVDAAVPATCTGDGMTEGKHCSACGVVLLARQTVKAAGHQYENGLCTGCGEADPDAAEPADPSEPEEHTHHFGPWVTVKEPTGEAEGAEERHCGCGETEYREIARLTNPFADVTASSYYYESVLWAAHRGITSGMSASQFGPELACTRAQVVTFLWRAAAEPELAEGENPFADVSGDAYYYKAVLWAVENGITTGMSRNRFGPDRSCTRAQVVTFLWRAAGEPEPAEGENPFADITGDAYYYKAVLWAVEQGITTGMGNGTFSPDSTCTRGQIVTFLHRAFAGA